MNKELQTFKFALRDDILDTEDLFLPMRSEPFATGYDVRACQKDRKDIILRAGQYFKIPLGFRSICPPNWYYQLHPRSSSFVKKSMHSLIGIVDFGWELETSFVGQYIPDIGSLGKDIIITFGDRIGQIIPTRREDINVETISNKEFERICKERNAGRGGGFGSSGDK